MNHSHSTKRSVLIIVGCIVAAIVGVSIPLLTGGRAFDVSDANAVQPTVVENQPVTGALEKGTPSYDTILPSGKSIKDYGGWTRVSPPNRNAVYAYADSINGTPIIVSQQPLPNNLSEQPAEQIGLLAKGYKAEKKLQAGSTTIYVGTSAKGPQSVIFTKNGLLVLIRANASLPDSEWQKYIQSLG